MLQMLHKARPFHATDKAKAGLLSVTRIRHAKSPFEVSLFSQNEALDKKNIHFSHILLNLCICCASYRRKPTLITTTINARKMKKLILTALSLVLVTVASWAQNGGQRQRLDPTEIYNRTAERLAKQFKLDDDKTEVFKVLYLDYQTARRNAANPKGENAENERVDFKKISDAEATELIQKQFAAQEAQLAVDKEYLAKFLEILTPVQAAQVYIQRGAQRNGQGGQGGFGRPGGFGGGPGGFGGGPGGFGGF